VEHEPERRRAVPWRGVARRTRTEATTVSAMPVTERQGGDVVRGSQPSPCSIADCVLDIMDIVEPWSVLGESVSCTLHAKLSVRVLTVSCIKKFFVSVQLFRINYYDLYV
jgi:hypothetical protein